MWLQRCAPRKLRHNRFLPDLVTVKGELADEQMRSFFGEISSISSLRMAPGKE